MWIQKKFQSVGEAIREKLHGYLNNEGDEKKKGFSHFVNGLKSFWDIIEDQKKAFRLIFFLVLGVASLSMVQPVIVKFIFDVMQGAYDTKQIPGMFFVYMAIFTIVGLVRNSLHSNWFQKKLLFELIDFETLMPVRAQKKLFELSMGFHTKENTGKTISKITSGCSKLLQIQMDLFWGLIPNFLYILVSVIVFFAINWIIGLIYVIFLAYIVKMQLKIARDFSNCWKEFQDLKEEADGVLTESVLNMRTVKSYNREAWELARHKEIRRKMHKVDLQSSYGIEARFHSLAHVLTFTYVGTTIAAFVAIIMGEATFGTAAFVVVTSGQMINNAWEISHSYRNILRNLTAVDHMAKLLKVDEIIEEIENPITFEEGITKVEFKNVWFRYSENDPFILKGLDLEINKNEMIAFVGKSGNGKSTILNLLSRFYDVTSGQILVNGVDIRMLKISWIRTQFAVVDQRVGIFEGPISMNVRYAYPNATDEEVKEALMAAQLQQVLENSERFEQGIETLVGERGLQLSGGEAQRVGIARAYLALLHGAEFLVLDESTASLDTPTEQKFQNAVKQIRSEMKFTIISIAHRIQTIQDSDLINVVKDGVIEESGSHIELLKLNGVYSELVAGNSQLQATY